MTTGVTVPKREETHKGAPFPFGLRRVTLPSFSLLGCPNGFSPAMTGSLSEWAAVCTFLLPHPHSRVGQYHTSISLIFNYSNSLQPQLLHNSRGRLDRRLHLAAHKCSLPCPGGQQAHSLLSFHPETWKSCNYEQWKTSAECIEWMEETFSWSLATLVLCLDRPPPRRVLCFQMLTYRFCFHQSDRGELRLWFCPKK